MYETDYHVERYYTDEEGVRRCHHDVYRSRDIASSDAERFRRFPNDWVPAGASAWSVRVPHEEASRPTMGPGEAMASLAGRAANGSEPAAIALRGLEAGFRGPRTVDEVAGRLHVDEEAGPT